MLLNTLLANFDGKQKKISLIKTERLRFEANFTKCVPELFIKAVPGGGVDLAGGGGIVPGGLVIRVRHLLTRIFVSHETALEAEVQLVRLVNTVSATPRPGKS